MKISILSLFPDFFTSPLNASILKRAQEKGIVNIQKVDIRDFADNKHRKVDDRPYGGGPGMVMMPEPVQNAIDSVRTENAHIVYLTPQGKLFDAKKAEELANKEHVVLLCGHYEGIDQRVIDLNVHEEISIGDVVLTSGCPAALIVMDALIRFIPGVLGDELSAYEDSFHTNDGGFDCPSFTRPYTFRGVKVPEVLTQGDHKKISEWRAKEGKAKTLRVRPDLNFEKKNYEPTH
ncbi:MAG: tRNA (guanosine(37)-N1)-methyltransferase TrmD [Chlamydiae bacterium]|nr:tRNA (guanosine(37)-N1)-methyltransferase TrmD [Chlamydiota bacterium]